MVEAERSARERQLTELNARGRWYSTQLWQVPFAYLGLTGLTIANAAGKSGVSLSVILFACGLFGLFVVVHTIGLRNGEKRAVRDIQDVEDQLHLTRTALYKPLTLTFPLQVAVIIATIAYFVLACLS